MQRRSVLPLWAAVFFSLLLFFTNQTEADYLSFQRVNIGIDTDIYGIVYGSKSGYFVAVGDSGSIATSSDGIVWYASNSRTGADLKAVAYKYAAYANDLYVAVGSSGTVVYSTDAINWHTETKVTSKTLKGIANRGSLFVAVGQEGVVLRSEAVGNWQAIQSPIQLDLNGVAYGNGLFAAVGNGGVIITSEDGATWTQRQSPVSTPLRAVAYGNGIFAAVGDNGVIVRSLDGVIWIQQNSKTGSTLSAVNYGAFAFFAVGQNGTIMLSDDAVTWGPLYTGINIWLNAVMYRNQIFVAPGFNASAVRAYNNYLVTNPSSINFGAVAPNSSVTQSFNIINTSSSPLTISFVSKSGSNQFTLSSDLCSGTTLPPGGTCRIEVSFLSGVAGPNTASIVIKSSTLPVSSTISLSAVSTGVLYSLTASKEGSGSGNVYSSIGGISCGNVCSAQILGGTSVTLYAIPENGSSFNGWSGYSACASNNPCTFTHTGSVTISASFN